MYDFWKDFLLPKHVPLTLYYYMFWTSKNSMVYQLDSLTEKWKFVMKFLKFITIFWSILEL